MDSVSVSVHSILYNNKLASLEHALEGLAQAALISKKENLLHGKMIVRYGDASPRRLISETVLSLWNARWSEFLDIQYFYWNENTGTAKGHNRLAKDVKNGYIMIMNPDIIISAKAIAYMLAPFAENEDVGMTEARQVPIEHHKEYSKENGETSWAATACAMYPAKVFHENGGYDEHFFMYCDDLDFSWRLRLLGYRIIYVPEAMAFHAKSLSVDGKWEATEAEHYYSAEAGLLMAYRWSREDILENILTYFESSSSTYHQKAKETFEKLMKEGKLPKKLDKDHKIADFVDGGYGKSRFKWS